jgi:hypothetical protein
VHGHVQALLTDKASILNCWTEYFQTLFSADRVVLDSAVPSTSVKAELDELPSMEEITKAIEQFKSR